MYQIQHLNKLFQEVGRRDGIHGLELGPEGTGGLELRNGVRLYFELDFQHDTLCIYTPLLTLPADATARLDLLSILLSANFAPIHTGALAIATHLDSPVYRHALHTADLTADQLDSTIDDVLRMRAFASSHIEHLLHQSTKTSAVTDTVRRPLRRGSLSSLGMPHSARRR